MTFLEWSGCSSRPGIASFTLDDATIPVTGRTKIGYSPAQLDGPTTSAGCMTTDVSGTNRVEFDATLEEVADVYMRLVRKTEAFRRSRSQYRWAAGVVVAGVLAVVLQNRIPLIGTIVLSAVGGLVSGYIYGPLYERSVEHSYVPMINEWYGGVSSVRCTFEMRERVLWAKTGAVEMSFPWSELTAINDAGDCIELWFNPGLAVIRNRAFHTEAERQAFLERARLRSS